MNTSSADYQKPARGYNIVLWIVQVLLAASFGMAGIMKITTPISELTAQMVWPGDMPEALVRFIGVSELAAAVGLILPSLLRIKPMLTVWAAIGLVVIMILALMFHVSRGEMQAIPINLAFALLATFVAWGRSKKAVIPAK